jgi:hypothetical protein
MLARVFYTGLVLHFARHGWQIRPRREWHARYGRAREVESAERNEEPAGQASARIQPPRIIRGIFPLFFLSDPPSRARLLQLSSPEWTSTNPERRTCWQRSCSFVCQKVRRFRERPARGSSNGTLKEREIEIAAAIARRELARRLQQSMQSVGEFLINSQPSQDVISRAIRHI